MKLSSRHFITTAFALAAVGGAAHCNATDVVIADLPQTDGGDGGGHHHGMPCTNASDCRASDFCDKHDCGDALGECHPRPIFCDTDGAFVCGCDNVTYWNDCLRRAGGVAASVAGECANPATCGGSSGQQCPAFGASCAHLFPGGGPPGPCPFDALGLCWVLPPKCPPSTGGQGWGICTDPDGACTDACTAIRAEVPYRSLPPSRCP